MIYSNNDLRQIIVTINNMVNGKSIHQHNVNKRIKEILKDAISQDEIMNVMSKNKKWKKEKIMGDRANVVLIDGNDQICLYTHWNGYKLLETVQSAFKRGKSRLDDYQYLNRIIFCEMVKGEEMELTGFGISHNIFDGEDKVITIDVEKQELKINDNKPIKFDVFMNMEKVEW